MISLLRIVLWNDYRRSWTGANINTVRSVGTLLGILAHVAILLLHRVPMGTNIPRVPCANLDNRATANNVGERKFIKLHVSLLLLI